MGWDSVEKGSCTMKPDASCQFESQIVDMHKAIYGNGDPEHGLLWMVKANTEFICIVKKHFWTLVGFSMLGVAAAIGNLLIQVFKIHFIGS